MKKVLLFEPSRSFAQFMEYVLSRLGYKVVHVDNAEQVLDEVGRTMPDIIIAETNIKDLSGIELCRRLKSDKTFSSIPVAIISIDGKMNTRQEALEAGCVEYLTKPVRARAINELIERHLPCHNNRRSLRVRMNVVASIRDGARLDNLGTQNIGEGGIYACTRRPPEIGTVLDMILPLPGLRSPLELKGEVIFTHADGHVDLPPGMGMKFLGMDGNTTTLFRHYLETYLSGSVPELHRGA